MDQTIDEPRCLIMSHEKHWIVGLMCFTNIPLSPGVPGSPCGEMVRES